MSEIAYSPVKQALASIKHLSADAETRRLAFVRERALSDEASLMRQEREKGRAEGKLEGKIEGEIEGRAKGLQEALSRLVESGMDEAQARRMLDL
jgi:hypothetical protein